MSTDRSSRFVQFPHPGDEHRPAEDDMAWNVGPHRRKFLSSPGRYLDGHGRAATGELTLWGEWEPPSRVLRRWPRSGRLPRVLHRPYWIRPRASGFRENTDPWIWGEQMLYSNCKQIVGDAFAVCTGGSITAASTDARAELTVYRGATAEHPVDGMYSFVPARPAEGDDARFARPAIRLPGLINPASKQSTWGSRRPLPPSTVRDAWASVRQQVLASGAVLAVHVDTPPEEHGPDPVSASDRSRC